MIRKILFLTFFCLFISIASHGQTQLTNLPTFYINTENGTEITSKEDYLNATITIKSSDEKESMASVTLEIRGRGNSTWGMPKKGYRLKFNSKTQLLGLPAKAKSWVILANYADKTLLRNSVAFEISRFMELDFTPSARLIDVVLNGRKLGTYLVSDQVEVGKNRVDVEEQKTTDTELPNISGGYLLEIDGFASGEPVWFMTNKEIPITIKYPKDDEINNQQKRYITQFTQNFENALFAENFDHPTDGFRKYVDEKSLIDWYIACELSGNSDSFWSTYIYKKRDSDKFHFGPLWDFDIAFNNDNRLGDAETKLMKQHGHGFKQWISQMMEDEEFAFSVATRWKELRDKGILEHLKTFIDKSVTEIDKSQKQNFSIWNILNKKVYYELEARGSYSAEVAFLKNYVEKRVAFLDKAFTIESTFIPNETYYYIRYAGSSHVIDLNNPISTPGTGIIIWEKTTGKKSQEWEIKPIKQNVFQLINKASGLALQAVGEKSAQPTQAAVDANNKLQQWRLINVGDNLWGISNVGGAMVLDNLNGTVSNGNMIIEWTDRTGSNTHQQWNLIEGSPLPSVGIENEVVLQSQLSIIPNPANTQTYLQFSLPEHTTATISVTSADGKCVYSESNGYNKGTNQIILSTQNLNNGLYIVTLSADKKLIANKKLVIIH